MGKAVKPASKRIEKEETTRPAVKAAERTRQFTYAVRDVVALAEEAARRGRKIYYLNIGDPPLFDFKTPRHIIDATYQAMLAEKTYYAPSVGVGEAIEAIRRDARSNKGIDNVIDVFVTSGVSEAIDISLSALADEGENVLVPTPVYPFFTAILAKLKVRANHYRLDEANRWQPDPDDIASRIDRKTRAIVLINPNNPTGALVDTEILRRIVEISLEHNLVIFADEIYDKLILDDDPHVSIASLNKEVSAITFNGMSKAYLGTGLRLGWGILSGAHAALEEYGEAIKKLLRARLCANHPLQYAIRPALEGDQSHIDEARHKLRRRRDLTVQMLNSVPGISCVPPKSAFYAFPRIEIDGTDADFVRALIMETGVLVVPGSGFGQAPGTNHFRVVYLPPEEVLKEAYEALLAFFRKYTGR